jgi:metallopeptidase MepB
MASDNRVSPQGPPDFSGLSPKDVLCEVENILEHSSDLQDSLATTVSPQEATFSNVIRPLVDELNRAKCRQQILGKILVAASPDSSLRDASREAQRLILAAETRRCMRVDIATLVSAVYKKCQESDDGIGRDRLDAEDMYLLTHVYNEYRQSGAALVDPDRRNRLQAVTTEIDELCLAAQKALTDAKDGIWLTQSELSGIPDASFKNLRTHAPGGVNGVEEQFWVPLHGTVPDQIMRDAVRGTTRHKLSVAVSKRCSANVERLEKIVALRHEAAALLGFPDHASRRMEEKMAESVEEVERLLIDIRQNVEIYAAKEIERLLQLKRQDVACRAHTIMDPEDDEETLFAWDWAFYSQKIRQTQYSLDTARISEYFEAEHTFQEMLGIFTRLFAIEFVPTRASTWHESVDVYEAWDNTGDKGFLGYLYVDLFTREGKYRNAQHIPINRVCKPYCLKDSESEANNAFV